MRDLFVTLVVFGSLPLILWRPFYGIIMWTWLGYMNPHRMAWGFSTSMPFAMMVAITTVVALLVSRESKKIPWTRETGVLLLLILWMCLTTAFAFSPAIAVEQLDKVLKIQFMTFVTLILLTQRERIHAVVWTVALSLGFYGIKGGIFTLLTGGGFRVQGPPGTFIEGNNELGLALLMTIPLMRYLQVEESRHWLKLGLTGAMVLTLIAALGTQSRGALVGLAVMGSMFIWKSPKRLSIMLLAAVAVPLILGFMPETWWDRMGTINNYEEDASAMGRIEAWTFATQIAMSNFMGGGFEALTVSGMRDVHSIYFEMLSEQGFFGLFLFLALLAFTWLSAGWIIRSASKHAELRWAASLARMLQVSGLAYCAAGAFLGMAYFDFIYLLVAITVATRRLVEQHIAALVPAPRRGLVPRSPVPASAVGARPARDTGNQQLATKASRAGRAPT
jgi:probable O-glycosylation ligase (exosortase A-associated)